MDRATRSMLLQQVVERNILAPKKVGKLPFSCGCFRKIVGFPPESSISIGFSIIFTIHFGGIPIFGNAHVEDVNINFFDLQFVFVSQLEEGPSKSSTLRGRFCWRDVPDAGVCDWGTGKPGLSEMLR